MRRARVRVRRRRDRNLRLLLMTVRDRYPTTLSASRRRILRLPFQLGVFLLVLLHARAEQREHAIFIFISPLELV